MLLQAEYYDIYAQPVYVVGWGGIGLLFGLISGLMLIQKGHVGEGVAAMILGCLCPLGGIIAIIVAVSRPDKRAEAARQAIDSSIQRQLARQRRQLAHHQRVIEEVAPPPPAFNPGQVRCPRCGSMNAAELRACWHCAFVFGMDAPPAIEGDVAADAPTPILPVEPVQVDNDRTPILAMPAVVESPANIKVRCTACKKKFSGLPAELAALNACPRCKASPFLSERV